MDAERYLRAIELFERCLPLGDEERRQLISRVCEGDEVLERQVLGMLAADEREDTPMIHDLIDRVIEAARDDSPPPEFIGKYRIIREIGRGGMGIVYEAEQAEPLRAVALKVLSAFGSSTMARRLRREASVLAALDHPGIARVVDTGVAEFRGQATPYIAMELIHGLPVDEHARRHTLTLEQRLELLARIADAVHAAHVHGVIHRDLKPGNILVMPEDLPVGRPKVLDFGVARVRSADIAVTTLRTETGQLIGTLSYMSPEQLDGHAMLDARSDVYSLGVLAFEILSGSRPVDLEGLSLVQAVERLRDRRDPPLLMDGAPAPEAISLVVSSAIAREPERRYASAAEFAADLRGVVAGTQVRARPPSASYQLREFARRNRLAVAVTTATICTLLLGAAGATWFGVAAVLSERESQWMTYRALITAASAAADGSNFEEAERLLDGTPEQHRGWEWSYLHARLAPTGEAFGGLCLRAMCADAASGSVLGLAEGTLVRWTPGESVGQPFDIAERVRAICPTAQSGRAVAILEDGSAIVLDTASGEIVRRFDAEGGIPWRTASLDTDARLACLTDGSLVELFDVGSGQIRRRWGEPGERIADAQVSPDGNWIATTSANGRTMLIDLGSGAEHRILHPVPGSRLAFSPDSALLAVGTPLRELHLVSVERKAVVRSLTGHTGKAISLAFTPKGGLVSAYTDHSWRLWDPETGEQLLAGLLAAEDSSIAVLPDLLLTSAPGTPTAVWSLNPGANSLDHPQYVYALCWSPDGSRLASTAFEDGGTRIWDPRTGALIAFLETDGRTLPVDRFTPDGKYLITGHLRSDGEFIRAWDTDSWSLAHTSLSHSEVASLWGGVGSLELPSIRYSPDGTRWIERRTETEWEIHTAAGLIATVSHPDRVRAVAWSPDGRFVVTGSQPGNAKVWRAPRFELAAELDHASGLWCAAFTPDGSRLATGGDDGIIRLFDVGRWEPVLELHGHRNYIHALAFSPDGHQLASGSGDGTVRIWDASPRPRR